MADFTVQIGKEKVEATFIVGCVCVNYKGNNYMIEPADKGWKQTVGTLDDKTIQAIGIAIEKYLKQNH
jgi:hypothetical protein